MQNFLAAYYPSSDLIRSRSVSHTVLHHTLDVPIAPTHVTADWQREISGLGTQSGDVEALSLARTILRWTDYSPCVQDVANWMHTLGLSELLSESDVALMACSGARYHHDAVEYGGAAFCNLFLSEDKGLDLLFPVLELRIPLRRGTAVIFDTAQPHAVVQRGCSRFNAADFLPVQDWSQVFLTWELPIENASLAQVLDIAFDIDPETSAQLDEGQVLKQGRPVVLCPETGCWLKTN